MPTAQARIPTNRATRYLAQLCQHTGRMRGRRLDHRLAEGHAPPPVRRVECTDTNGTIDFASGTCTLHATADALTLRIEAADEEGLRRLQDLLAARLESIGRRDRLAVTWQRTGEPTVPAS